jgi:glucose/arabinose dehydrogenase
MKRIFTCLVSLSISFVTISQPRIVYQLLAEGFNMPVDIAHCGDNRLFVAERSGLIRIIDSGVILPTPFLDVSHKTSIDGDRGLLSFTFHPDYIHNGFVYVYYTKKTTADNLDSSGAIIIERYKVSSTNLNLADIESGNVMVSILKPLGSAGTFKDHNGGDLNFGPDGQLYFGTGDGGKEAGMAAPGDPYNNAQNPNSRLGKLLRIDVDKGNAAPEQLSLGLRNPWRFSFDRANGDIWIGDVGHYKWEEVDVISNTGKLNKPKYAATNFGWRCYEANEQYNTSLCNYLKLDFPEYKYVNKRSSGGPPASVTGGFVYRGTEYPSLYGYYVSADMYSGDIHFVRRHNGSKASFVQQSAVSGIVSFGEGKNGTLYAVSIFTGKIYKIVGENTPLLYPLPTFFVSVFPTIVNNRRLTIQSPEMVQRMEIFSMAGQLVFARPVNSAGQINVTLPQLAKGVYIAKVYTLYSEKSERIIIH